MPVWATGFVVIHFQLAADASCLKKQWAILNDWCGLKLVHGPVHQHGTSICGIVWGGQLDTKAIPAEVTTVQVYALSGNADQLSFEWPDGPHNGHLRLIYEFPRYPET